MYTSNMTDVWRLEAKTMLCVPTDKYGMYTGWYTEPGVKEAV